MIDYIMSFFQINFSFETSYCFFGEILSKMLDLI